MQLRCSLVAISVIAILNSPVYAKEKDKRPEPVVLASNYSDEIDLEQYWQSEKLDGIRAVWDGSTLRTRRGNPIAAPTWFTKSLPNFPLEGELWAGRGNFHIVQQTVLDQLPKQVAWSLIRYMLFDIPYSDQSYLKRYDALQSLVNTLDTEHIQLIEHTPIESQATLFDNLERVTALKGEGLMLRNIHHAYHAGRSQDLIKLKKQQDGEAVVVGYKPGKGKFSNMMGALLVELPNGQRFYIGNGFSDEQRHFPPPLGSRITYQFNGYTQNGVPKFARFLRAAIDQ
ncbi:DNA ligase [Vibrio sp. TRT 2004]|uniref:DNA ligase n=1 Tax=Vibrio sp. TRT 2004 TaxID=3418506 RepID=UPI003CF21ED4